MAKAKSIPTNPSDHPLIALCKQHGNDAANIRDAAHEIFHARYAGTKSWDREIVHRALSRKFSRQGPAFFWLHEMRARAVEQIVSKHFGYDCGAIDKWVHTSILEAIKWGLAYADFDISVKYAKDFIDDRGIVREAEQIIALVEPAAAERA